MNYTAQAVAAVVLVWLQIVAAEATGNPVPTCQSPAGPEKMVVVNAPTPYFSWDECNDLANADKDYPTELIDEVKHVGVVTKL